MHPPEPALLQADRLAEDLLGNHGCIDVLVNAAGAYPDSGKIDPLEGDPDAWEAAFGWAWRVAVYAQVQVRDRRGPACLRGGFVMNADLRCKRAASATRDHKTQHDTPTSPCPTA